MKKIIGIIIFILVSWIFYSFLGSKNKEQWQPIYYPDTGDLSKYSYGPTVDTLEQCRGWINAESIKRNQQFGEFDYECGLNCKYDMIYDLQICKETLQ
jgi:hypothetical protein